MLYEAATGHHPFLPPLAYDRPAHGPLPAADDRRSPGPVAPPAPRHAVGTALDACLEVRPSDRPTLTELDACLATVVEPS